MLCGSFGYWGCFQSFVLDFPLVSQPIWNKIPPSGSSSSYLSPMEANNLCSQLVSRTRIAPHPAAQMLRCLRFVISKLCSPWNLETNHPSNSWATIKTVPGANKRHQQIIGPTTRRKRTRPNTTTPLLPNPLAHWSHCKAKWAKAIRSVYPTLWWGRCLKMKPDDRKRQVPQCRASFSSSQGWFL